MRQDGTSELPGQPGKLSLTPQDPNSGGKDGEAQGVPKDSVYSRLGSLSYGPQAPLSPPTSSVNEVLLAHSQAHVFAFCIRFVTTAAELSNDNTDHSARKT